MRVLPLGYADHPYRYQVNVLSAESQGQPIYCELKVTYKEFCREGPRQLIISVPHLKTGKTAP